MTLFGVSLTREVEQVKFALSLEANHDRPSKVDTLFGLKSRVKNHWGHRRMAKIKYHKQARRKKI
jgi:hypothetical protein